MDRCKGTHIFREAVIYGDVRLGDNVFVAPTAVLRADEPETAIVIGDNCNVQDGVIVHALAGSKVEVCDSTSLAHGCLVHGPCMIGKGSFIGFRSIVFNAELGEGTIVMHGTIVMNVKIPPGKLVPPGSVVDIQEKVEDLRDVSEGEKKFAEDVVKTNLELLEKYLGNMSDDEEQDILCVGDIARLDVLREKRTGIPEAVFAEGKEAKDVIKIALELAKDRGYALVTRANKKCIDGLKDSLPEGYEADANYRARTILVTRKGFVFQKNGRIGILAAGTSDIPVAEEAKVAAEVMGCEVTTAYDVGIAGLHRVFPPLKNMLELDVSAIVVAAGMEGALPSVVSGLVDVPVVGVPTSVGYGIGGEGTAALMTMLQTCSPGLAVVNIDNGFGAGVFAALIARNRR